jgi:ABC-2 type transport system permease protein
MHNILLMAKREYVERVGSKAFRVTTLLVPLAFAAILGIGALSSRLGGGPKHVLVASNDPVLANSVAAELNGGEDGSGRTVVSGRGSDKSPRDVTAMTLTSSDGLVELNRRVDNKEIDGYLWLDVKPGAAHPEATFASRSSTNLGGQSHLQNAIGHALVREELRKRGVTEGGIEALLKNVELNTVRIKDGVASPSDTGKSFWGAYIMAFLLYFSLMFYGVNVAQSVAAEKNSRVFEVLLTSAKPHELMAGKLVGVGGAGLTQLVIWIGCLLILSSSSLAAHLVQGGLAAYGVTPVQLLFLSVYFLLGFFFYSSLSAGIGASVGQESEVQQLNMLIVLPQIVAILLTVYILGNPAAWPVVLLSLIPPFTPIVMCLRMAAMAVPAWQLALSVALMAISIYGTLWLATRLYRVGILMYGKRATLPEMMRWLRYS